jgi:hypothetical protein
MPLLELASAPGAGPYHSPPGVGEREVLMGSRFTLAVVSAVVLTIGLAGNVAAADKVSGQVGHYAFTDSDSSNSTGAQCLTTDVGNATYDLTQIVGRAPAAWWPDTNSDKTTQHGTVGWRLIVLHKAPAASSWTVLKKSTIQKATAFEDQLNPYGAGTKAPFTDIGLKVSASNFPTTELFAAKAKVIWYRKDGSVKGSVVHFISWYATMYGVNVLGINPSCYDRALG